MSRPRPTKALKNIIKKQIFQLLQIFIFTIKEHRGSKSGANCLINPGNIGSNDRVKEVIKAAKDYNCAIRIGVNAGSLEKNFRKI